MGLELDPLGTLTILIDEQARLPDGRGGTRVIGISSRCRWEGPRIQAASTLAPATDWVAVAPDGMGSVDARMTLRTDDGAIILVRYAGRISYRGERGASVVVAPTFETSDERYAWLNGVQAIGKGERRGDRLVYEMYAVR